MVNCVSYSWYERYDVWLSDEPGCGWDGVKSSHGDRMALQVWVGVEVEGPLLVWLVRLVKCTGVRWSSGSLVVGERV